MRHEIHIKRYFNHNLTILEKLIDVIKNSFCMQIIAILQTIFAGTKFAKYSKDIPA